MVFILIELLYYFFLRIFSVSMVKILLGGEEFRGSEITNPISNFP